MMATARRSAAGYGVLAAAASLSLLAVPASAYTHCKVVDCDNKYVLRWSSSRTEIQMSMEAVSAGYVAFGLSSGGASAMGSTADSGKSDIVLGWLPDTMTATPAAGAAVRDYHVSSYARPTLDAEQDVTLLAASYNATLGVMRFEWKRSLVTPTSAVAGGQDRSFTPGTPQTVIWATNPGMGAVTSPDGSTFTKHLSNTRGYLTLDFGAPSACEPCLLPGGIRAFDALLGECLANGWPPNEATGDRDDGKAWPRIRVPVPSPSPTPAASPSSAATATASAGATASASPWAPPPEWPNAAINASLRSPDGVFAAAWTVTGDGFTIVHITSRARGWMSLGWTRALGGGMAGMDAAVAWVVPRVAGATACTGVTECDVHLTDRSAPGFVQPVASEAQDLVLLHASYTPDEASVTFKRALVTGDAAGGDVSLAHDAPAVTVLWAYGAEPGRPDGSFDKHSVAARGQLPSAPWLEMAVGGGSVEPSPSRAPAPSPSPGPAHAGLVLGEDIPRALPDANATAILVSPDGVLRASWAVSPSGLYTAINLVSSAKGWMALGWNAGDSAVMTGMDALVVWAAPRGGATACDGARACDVHVSDRYGFGRAQPTMDAGAADPAGDLILLDAFVTPEYASVTVLRPLRTPTAGGNDVDLANAAHLLWAYGSTIGDMASGSISQHAPAARGAAVGRVPWAAIGVDPNTGAPRGAGIAVTSGGSRTGGAYALHGSAMVTAYWVLMLLAAWIGRYRTAAPVLSKASVGMGVGSAASAVGGTVNARCTCASRTSSACRSFHSKQVWFLLHVYLHTAAIIAATVGLAAIQSVTSKGGSTVAWGTHQRAGVVALALAYGQYVLGAARPALAHPRRALWLAAHRFVAVLTFGAAFVAIPTGLALSGLLPSSAVSAAVALHTFFAVTFTAAMEGEVTLTGGLVAGLKAKLRELTGRSRSPTSSFDMSCENPVVVSAGGGVESTRAQFAPVCGGGGRGTTESVSAPHFSNNQLRANWAKSTETTTAAATSSKPTGSASLTASTLLGLGAAVAVVVNAALVSYVLRADGGAIPSFPSVLQSGAPRFARNVTADITARLAPGSARRRAAIAPASRSSAVGERALGGTMDVAGTTYSYTNLTDGKYPGGDRTLCFHMYNFEVPVADTSYMCRAFALPADVPLQALEFVPMIDNAAVAHHMLLMGSDVDLTMGFPGFTMDARGMFECGSVPTSRNIFVWAVGSGALAMPPDAGLRVGVGGIKYVFLQIHYSNPSGTRGLFDSSGISVRVTDRLRPQRAVLLSFGAPADAQLVIPPNKPAYGLESRYIIPAVLSPAPVVFAVMYHAHTLGKRVWTELYRGPGANKVRVYAGGTDALGREDAFDFGVQRFLTTNVTLQYGDELVTRAVFENTVARGLLFGNLEAAANRTVYGGEKTSSEMIMAFMYLSPVPPTLNEGWFFTPPAPFCDDTPTTVPALPPCSSFS